ncbi:hypothetical protein DXB23_12680 [Dorea sp. OM02-2LB]|nr:hypothetical protein DXB23_12680 [Dorea sp. OM02-2LB]
MKKKIIKGVLLLAMAVLFLTGCSRNNVEGYVEGVLNATYKGDYAKYIHLTKCSQSEAQNLHTERIDECMKALEDLQISDDLKEQYRQFFQKELETVRFTVNGKKKEKGGYNVEVSVEPYSMFQGVDQELEQKVDKYSTEVTEAALKGTPFPDENQLREKVYELLLEILNDHMNHITYGEAETINIHVTEGKYQSYSIDGSELKKLDKKLVNLKELGLE